MQVPPHDEFRQRDRLIAAIEALTEAIKGQSLLQMNDLKRVADALEKLASKEGA